MRSDPQRASRHCLLSFIHAVRRRSDSHCPAGIGTNMPVMGTREPGRRAVWDRVGGKSKGKPTERRRTGMPSRLIGLWCWAYLVWALLTWTLTIEQVLFGVLIAAPVAVALAPLGEVPGPWRLLRPRALAGGAWLLAAAAGRS